MNWKQILVITAASLLGGIVGWNLVAYLGPIGAVFGFPSGFLIGMVAGKVAIYLAD